MRITGGSSGARLEFQGEWILKRCKDAKEQVDWFREAEKRPLLPGIYLPAVELVDEQSYRIERIAGIPGTFSQSLDTVFLLYEQVKLWSNQVCSTIRFPKEYCSRLRNDHLPKEGARIVHEAIGFFESEFLNVGPKGSTFCHGDLTLENVILMNDGSLGIIDPNHKSGLYQSFLLDFGKILQSIHSDYHRKFDCCPGVDQTWMYPPLYSALQRDGFLRNSLLSEISHLVRLRKYRPEEQRPLVDRILQDRMFEYRQLYL
jgi:hypothetical protein